MRSAYNGGAGGANVAGGQGRQIDLWINGERRSVDSGVTLAGLIDQLGLEPDRVAIERNREIARRPSWTATDLGEGDRIEIVHFVGGG